MNFIEKIDFEPINKIKYNIVKTHNLIIEDCWNLLLVPEKKFNYVVIFISFLFSISVFYSSIEYLINFNIKIVNFTDIFNFIILIFLNFIFLKFSYDLFNNYRLLKTYTFDFFSKNLYIWDYSNKINFSDIKYSQIIVKRSNKFSKTRNLFLYEYNFVLNNWKRINILDHNDLYYIKQYMKIINSKLNITNYEK